MAKAALDLFHKLTESGGKVLTFPRKEFDDTYRRTVETQRMLQVRLDATLEPYNTVVAFGMNVVIVAHDSNFAPHRPMVCCCDKGPPGAKIWECPLHGEQQLQDMSN
jgi:hypothetical protein